MNRTRLETVREYQLDAGEVPDLQDDRKTTRMVIRPMKVEINQVFGSTMVRGAVIHGRQINRVGDLAGWRMILVGLNDRYDSAPPPWLNELLDSEGLVWMTDRNAVAP
jgi:hypothetical protein